MPDAVQLGNQLRALALQVVNLVLDGFNRMVDDAMHGKIDLILTKSISRFSRNTVDALTITRKLRSSGIDVFFEKEGISSMDPNAELIFTILCTTAQEESRSISENVRWARVCF